MLLQARGLAQARAQAAAGAATAGVVHPCAVGIRASFGSPALTGNDNLNTNLHISVDKASGSRPQRLWHRCTASSTGSSSSPATMDTSEAPAVAEASHHDGDDMKQRESTPAWSVLNFYHLVDIAEPQEMLARHKAYIAANGLDSICGRIYISNQGINCQGGGLKTHTEQYVAWVASQPEFHGLFHTLWPADGAMFPKLRLKVKPNLISLSGGMSSLPCTDPSMRATPLQPREWRDKMSRAAAMSAAGQQGQEEQEKRVVVMDLRNDYEWDAGHFDFAPRPDEEVFAETPVPAASAASDDAEAAESSQDEDDGVPGAAEDLPSPLRGADPETTEVLMYCTGGIRCDVYSAALRQKGFKNLYTLHGGIQNYLREEGNDHWQGSLFVFDGRMAINPALQQQDEDVLLPAAVPCQLCGAQATLPHVNCANMDCNELFIACSACKTRFHGCCCESCQSAPRLLRPIKVDGGNYGTWGNYADVDALGPVINTKRSNEGRVARRARRREAMKAKREVVMAEKRDLRAAMKAAMKAAQEAEEEAQSSEQLCDSAVASR